MTWSPDDAEHTATKIASSGDQQRPFHVADDDGVRSTHVAPMSSVTSQL